MASFRGGKSTPNRPIDLDPQKMTKKNVSQNGPTFIRHNWVKWLSGKCGVIEHFMAQKTSKIENYPQGNVGVAPGNGFFHFSKRKVWRKKTRFFDFGLFHRNCRNDRKTSEKTIWTKNRSKLRSPIDWKRPFFDPPRKRGVKGSKKTESDNRVLYSLFHVFLCISIKKVQRFDK